MIKYKSIMKIKYKKLDKPLPHYKIMEREYCCSTMKNYQKSDLAYISPTFILGVVDECPWCDAKIELQEVT